jgi:uncharacterized damage-inducible protein DinB
MKVPMTEIARIQDTLQRIYNGHSFYGDPIEDVLANIDAQQAFWIPQGGTHSIWQIVQHMTVWLRIIRERLTSPTIVDVDSNDETFATSAEATHENWNAARQGFHAALLALIDAAGKFPPEKLDAMVPEREYTFYVLLHGAAQHSLYHTGQIALMKRMWAGR